MDFRQVRLKGLARLNQSKRVEQINFGTGLQGEGGKDRRELVDEILVASKPYTLSSDTLAQLYAGPARTICGRVGDQGSTQFMRGCQLKARFEQN